ncbi:sugar nucleotide-binding protein [Micromonospora coxensis]|uniref:sugar nucleotide-binding protein n=1 Tax=Micromonospora coxensis TaxID=356852 RepID=UPI003444A96B
MTPAPPVVIVGRGLIGAAVARRLRSQGHPTVTVGLTPDPTGEHLPVDLSGAPGRTALGAAVRRLRPRVVVLTHGPSDVTWIEDHEEQAAEAHVGTARTVAELGVPTLLVSTDNVFAGDRPLRRPADPIAPANAYGRVKAAAERAVRDTGQGLVLRVSLVYGWTDQHRATYGQRCLVAAHRGEPLPAPVDQDFTPVHVSDVAQVLAALCAAPALPVGVRHLAGPEQLSRYDFARLAYRLSGADERLVRPCQRAETQWASRPRYSSLACDDFAASLGVDGWLPMSAEAGLRAMLAEAPVTGSARAGR